MENTTYCKVQDQCSKYLSILLSLESNNKFLIIYYQIPDNGVIQLCPIIFNSLALYKTDTITPMLGTWDWCLPIMYPSVKIHDNQLHYQDIHGSSALPVNDFTLCHIASVSDRASKEWRAYFDTEKLNSPLPKTPN